MSNRHKNSNQRGNGNCSGSLLPPALWLEPPQLSFVTRLHKHRGFSLPKCTYCTDISQLQAARQPDSDQKVINMGYETAAASHCYSPPLWGQPALAGSRKKQCQRPSFPQPFHQPDPLMKPAFSSCALCTESCLAQKFLPQEIHSEHSYLLLFVFSSPNPAEVNWCWEQIPF